MSTIERWQQPFRNVPVHAEWISVWHNGGVQWSVEEPKFGGHIWLTEYGQQGCLQWIDLPSDPSKALRRVLPEERMVERVQVVKQVIGIIDGLEPEKLAKIRALMVHALFQWGGEV